MKNKVEWWRGAVIYQIYPRSFLDTNNDGVGDLAGITQKLDYIASLGVDGIWISPFFTSPMKDFGYDVSDYRDVDPLFGTLEDFKILLKKAHSLNLKIIIDLVLSHTSDQHPWFKDKPEYYVWADGRNGGPPNNWVSVFGGPAWTYDESRKKYYLHNFLKEQPDLNYHNPDLQNEIFDIARFWLDLGVDGFRLDVVNFYFHDQELRDNPPRDPALGAATQFEGDDPYSKQEHIYDKSQPENLEFIRKLRQLMDEYPGRFTVGEIGDDDPIGRSIEYTGKGLLNTTYNTQMMSGKHKDLNATLIREPVDRFQNEGPHCWPSWAFSNHDVVRAVSRWHKNKDGFSSDAQLAKMLIALLGCLHGTMFMYQGEELGLPEAKLNLEDLKDPWGIHLWPAWQGRDGCRTPMPWNDAPHGGFSLAKPWLPFAESQRPLNIAAQEKDPASVLNFTREFLKFRNAQPALRTGKIEFLNMQVEHVLLFERFCEDQGLVCIFDLREPSAEIQGPGGKMLWSLPHI